MELKKYLEISKLTCSEFARRAGLPRITVLQYVTRARQRPSRQNMRKIVEATKGQVTPNDFYQIGGDA